MLQLLITGKVSQVSDKAQVIAGKEYRLIAVEEKSWVEGEIFIRVWYVHLPGFLWNRAEKLVAVDKHIGITAQRVDFATRLNWMAVNTAGTIYAGDIWILA